MDLRIINSYIPLLGAKTIITRKSFSRTNIFTATFKAKTIFQEQGSTPKKRVQQRNTDLTALNKKLIICVSHECFIS